jgi:hypothetical protein
MIPSISNFKSLKLELFWTYLRRYIHAAQVIDRHSGSGADWHTVGMPGMFERGGSFCRGVSAHAPRIAMVLGQRWRCAKRTVLTAQDDETVRTVQHYPNLYIPHMLLWFIIVSGLNHHLRAEKTGSFHKAFRAQPETRQS